MVRVKKNYKIDEFQILFFFLEVKKLFVAETHLKPSPKTSLKNGTSN